MLQTPCEEVFHFLKTSILKFSAYKEELNSLGICAKLTKIRTQNEVLQIEMDASTISSSFRIEVEEKHPLYMKNTKELLKRQLE